MRRLAACLLTLLLLLNAPSAAAFDTCSCTADDNSCTTSTSCPGGCIAYCPSGACRSACKKGGTSIEGGDGGDGGDLTTILSKSVTLQLRKGSSAQLSSALARITGRSVVFTPNNPGEAVNLDVKDFPLWDVLDVLSGSGAIKLGGHEFSKLQAVRKALVAGERMSVCIHNVSVKALLEEYAVFSGLPIRAVSGDDTVLVTFSAKGVTLEEILAEVSSRTGVQIALR